MLSAVLDDARRSDGMLDAQQLAPDSSNYLSMEQHAGYK
jgi:hypothetical protein